jgi:hypothetical protein
LRSNGLASLLDESMADAEIDDGDGSGETSLGAADAAAETKTEETPASEEAV